MYVTGLAKINPKILKKKFFMVFISGSLVLLSKAESVTGKC